MRDIKFRGKPLLNNAWIVGYLIIDNISDKYYILPNGNSCNESDKMGEEGLLHIFTFEVDKKTIGQYTGLKDRNMKEIYEGDIVKITEKKNILKHKVIPMKPIIAEISWSEEYLAYILITTSAKDAFENLADYLEEYDLEVIGNIYDNPELLEEGE